MEKQVGKEWSNLRKWQIWKLKLIDARLYFVSIFVGGCLRDWLLCLITIFSGISLMCGKLFHGALSVVLACIVVFYLMGDSDLCRFFGKNVCH